MNGIKAWEDLKISDDFLFAKVMRDKKICKQVLEKLLHIKIKDLEYLEEQKTIDIKADAKSVRLDVYVEDGDRVFNVEMQTTNQKDLSKRSRYYQAMIDLNTIEKRLRRNFQLCKNFYFMRMNRSLFSNPQQVTCF